MSAFSVRATITADDKTGKALASVRKNMQGLAKDTKALESALGSAKFKSLGNIDVGKLRSAQREVSAMARAMQRLRGIGSTRINLPSVTGSSQGRLNALIAVYRRGVGPAQSFAQALRGINAALAQQANLSARAARAQGRYSRGYGSHWTDPRWQAGRAVDRAGGAAMRATGRGMMGQDSAEAQIRMVFGHKPDVVAALRKAALESTARTKAWSYGDALQAAHESGLAVQSPKDAGKLMPGLEKIVRLATIQGSDRKETLDGLYRIVKAIGNTGQMTNKDGSTNVPAFNKLVDQYIGARAATGKDLDPRVFQQYIKYLKTTGQTATPDAIRRGLIYAADYGGSSTGNAVDQLVRQLTGKTTKQAMAAQKDWGLITGDIKNGPRGAKRFHYSGTPDEESLRMDIFDWFKRRVVPKLKEKGIDPSDAPKVTKALSPLFGRATAENMAAMIVLQQQETQNVDDKAKEIAADTNKALKRAEAGSINTGLQSNIAQFEGLMGRVANSFSGVINPALEKTANLMSQLGQSGDGQKPGAATTGLVLGAGGAMLAVKAISESGAAMPAHTFAMLAHTRALAKASAPGLPDRKKGGGKLATAGLLAAGVGAALAGVDFIAGTTTAANARKAAAARKAKRESVAGVLNPENATYQTRKADWAIKRQIGRAELPDNSNLMKVIRDAVANSKATPPASSILMPKTAPLPPQRPASVGQGYPDMSPVKSAAETMKGAMTSAADSAKSGGQQLASGMTSTASTVTAGGSQLAGAMRTTAGQIQGGGGSIVAALNAVAAQISAAAGKIGAASAAAAKAGGGKGAGAVTGAESP
ncbi:MAG: hypothetical protein AB7F96_16465 [Beijerinckiaceae bacterium]